MSQKEPAWKEVVTPFAVRESRDAEILFRKVEQRIDLDDYLGASWFLQEIIDRYSDRTYRVGGDTLRYRGFYARCHDVLKSFPEEGVKAYGEAFDDKAGALFREGVERGDLAALREVVRRFFFSSFGEKALRALGRFYVERGDWKEAAYYLESALNSYSSRAQFPPQDLALYALCLSRMGREGDLRSVAARTSSLLSQSSLQTGGEPVTLANHFSRLIEEAAHVEKHEETKWDYYNIPQSESTVRILPDNSWETQWTIPVRHEDAVMVPMRNRLYRSRFRVPAFPFYPVASEGRIYLNGGGWISAHDLFTGDPLWSYSPIPDGEREQIHHTQIFSAGEGKEILYVNLQVSRGERDYSFHMEIQPSIPERKLFAFRKETGELIWSQADGSAQDPETAEFLDRLSIITPPLIVGETLYAAGSYFEGKIHTYLCSFCALTGRLKWKTLVCTGQQELNMFGNPFKEYFCSPLAEVEGVVYFCSNLGVVAAVDSHWGNPLWISSYETTGIPVSTRLNVNEERPPGWFNGPPMAAGDLLFVTPTDSEYLLALEKETGELAWKLDRRSGGYGLRYFLGADESRAYVSGQVLLALDRETGIVRWTRDWRGQGQEEGGGDRTGNALAGRGILTATHVILPTLQGLLIFEKESGELDPARERGMTGRGNLLLLPDVLLSASETNVNAYFTWKRILARLHKIMEAPEKLSNRRLIELAGVYRQAKDFSSALEVFRRVQARKSSRTILAGPIRKELFRTYFQWAIHLFTDQDWQGAFRKITSAQEYATEKSEQIACLVQLSKYYRQNGNRRELKKICRILSEQYSETSYPFYSPGEVVKAGLFGLICLEEILEEEGAWKEAIRTFHSILEKFPNELLRGEEANEFAVRGIDRLLKLRGREIYEEFDEEAAALFREGMEKSEPRLLERVIESFPNCTVREGALFSVAWLYIQRGENSRAATRLRRVCADYPNSPYLPSSLALLAHLYSLLGFDYSARELASLVTTSGWEDKIPPEGPRASEILENLQSFPPSSAEDKLFSAEGDIESSLLYHYPAATIVEFLHPTVRGKGGEEVLFFYSRRAISAFHLKEKRILWKREIKGDRPHGLGFGQEKDQEDIVLIDGHLIVSTDEEVSVLRVADGSLRWNFKEGHPWGITVGGGLVYILMEGEDDQDEGLLKILAIDFLSGEKIWESVLNNWYSSRPSFRGRDLILFLREPPKGILFDSLSGKQTKELMLGGEDSYLSPFPLVGEHGILLCELMTGGTSARIIERSGMRTLFTRDFPNLYLRTTKSIYPSQNRGSILVYDRKQLVFEVLTFNIRSAQLEWRRRLEGSYTFVDFQRPLGERESNTLFLKVKDRSDRLFLMALSSDTGETLWKTLIHQKREQQLIFLLAGPETLSMKVVWSDRRVPLLKAEVLVIDKKSGEVLYQKPVDENTPYNIAKVGAQLCIAAKRGISVLSR